MTETLARVLTFLAGGCFGSFLNVCVSRWPKEQSVIAPRSRCPTCGHEIAWYENIPWVSWLAMRARCRGCRSPISVIYPLVELVVGLLWLASFVQFGLTFTSIRIAVLGTVLLGIMLTDASDYIIPDGFTLFGLVWALTAAIVAPRFGDSAPFAGLYDGIIGACAGAGAIAIAGWIGEMAFKKEAMGFGDVTLMAMVGAHLGPARSLLTVFLGALLGATVFLGLVYPVEWVRSRRRNTPFDPPLVPFGVFLAPAAMIALLAGTPMLRWYLHEVLGL